VGDILVEAMQQRRAFRGVPLAGTATAGVVLGHWLSYVLALPETRVRGQALMASGHGYWLSAVKIGVVAFVAALACVAVRHLSGHADEGAPFGERLSWLAGRLALVQILGFTAMEVTERVAFGAPVGGMFLHHLYFLGLAVQVLIAAVGALVLLWFGRAAASVAARMGARPRRAGSAAVAFVRVASSHRRPLVLHGAAGLRGPPAPSIA
jgi:hypothetical protein